jgi:hypothetical protein
MVLNPVQEIILGKILDDDGIEQLAITTFPLLIYSFLV